METDKTKRGEKVMGLFRKILKFLDVDDNKEWVDLNKKKGVDKNDEC